MIDPNSGLETKVTMEAGRSGVVEEPPFHILVLGDWAGDAERRPLSARKPVEIDRDNFDQVIGRLGTRLQLDLEGGTLTLDFKELDDFHPDQIFRRVPIFSELRDLRKRLRDESTFNTAAREVRERFGSADPAAAADVPSSTDAPADAPPADDLLDAILSKPSGGAAAPKPGVSQDVAALVSDLVRPHLVSVDETEQSQLVSSVDEATGGLMRSILHHRRFQELEAAWRGLFFLVRRAETSADHKIFLLDVTKEELASDLKEKSGLSETALYVHLVRDTLETPGGEPFALTLGNYAFEANVDDIATLMRIGKIAGGANAPFISHIRPDIFGVHSLAENADPSTWKLSSDSNESKLWRALCDQTEAVYVGMVIPRILARLPYGAETDPLETFSFEEFSNGPVHDQYVWTNGCFAAGYLLSASYSNYGWEMNRALMQDIDGLPVHVYKEETETIYKPCSEVLLTDVAIQRLMELGFMPLATYKNSDRVKLARFQSIADTALKAMWN